MKLPELDSEAYDHIIEMAWEDRTPFKGYSGLVQPIRARGDCPDKS
jgi:hypothetical protein